MSECYADPNPTFKPAMRLITAITQNVFTTVTTSFDHGYTTGLTVRINIPPACGMEQLDGFVGDITVTGATTFTLDIDSTYFQPFAIPAAPYPIWADTCAQVIPIGENNSMLTEATRNVLP